MEFPSQYPDSPAKPLSGPSRARLAARHARTSSLKPYARRSSLATQPNSPATDSSSSLNTQTHSPSTPSASSPSVSSSAAAALISRSPFSSLRVASPIALLGSMGKAITRPLSWLTSSTTSAQPDAVNLGIPASSSSGSLSLVARKRAALQATLQPKADQDAPTLAARAIGAKLAAGVSGNHQRQNDVESQIQFSQTSTHLSQRQSNLPSAPPKSTMSPPTASSPRLSHLDPSASYSWSRASKKTLDLGKDRHDAHLDSLNPRSPSPAGSGVGAVILEKGRQRLSNRPSPLAANYTSAGYHRASSSRPEAYLDQRQANQTFVFGYGNETRIAQNSLGLPPPRSPFQVSTRSPLAARIGRASLGAAALPESMSSPGRLRVASPAAQRAASPAESAAMTPNSRSRRNWSSINLAAPPSPSMGDDMMKEYMASRTLSGLAPTRNILANQRVTNAMAVDSDEPFALRLGKRDMDMSVDEDDDRSALQGGSRKRQMVWHPELGFVSQEQLKAREYKPPPPKNEAERLLNILENMRTPLSAARAAAPRLGAAPSRAMHTVPVPVPVSDRSLFEKPTLARGTKDKGLSASVAPYSMALRKSKLAQSYVEQGDKRSMRDKLKRSRNIASQRQVSDQEDDEPDQMLESETESELEVATTKKEPLRRSRRIQQSRGDDNDEMAVESEEEKPTRRARKVYTSHSAKTPLQNASKQGSSKEIHTTAAALPEKIQTDSDQEAKGNASSSFQPQLQVKKPTSHRISLAAAAAKPATAPIKRDNFAIRSDNDQSGSRERSSLRQAATKTTRKHQSVNKFSAWDEDEEDEDDLPDAQELAKIKLPQNLFPTGFSFGANSSNDQPKPASSFNSVPPAAPARESMPSASGGSLLGRLGGFSQPDGNQAKPAEPTAPQKAAPAVSFSFTAPTKENPKPAFAFTKPAAAADSKDSDVAPKSTIGTDFFSKPSDTAAKPKAEEKKSGPVPNFFQSALAKAESKETDSPKETSLNLAGSAGGGGGMFSLDKPAMATGSSGATMAATSSFTGFGQTTSSSTSAEGKAKEETKSSASAAAQNPFATLGSSSTQKPVENAFNQPVSTTTPFSLGPASSAFSTATKTNNSTGSSFSFGAPEKETDKNNNKLAEGGSEAKIPASTFSFGAPTGTTLAAKLETPSTVTSVSTVPGFAFGKPAESSEVASTVPSFFGTNSTGSTSLATTPSFTFGKPVEAAKDTSNLNEVATASTSKPVATFSFGAPATTTDAKPETSKPVPSFTFGSPTPPPSVSTTTPSFTFGTPKPSTNNHGGFSEMMEDSPSNGTTVPQPPSITTTAAAVPTPTPTPSLSTFTFGQPNNASSTPSPTLVASTIGKPMTFSFGSTTPSTNTTTNPFGFASTTTPQQVPPAFTFGTTSIVPPTTTAAAVTATTTVTPSSIVTPSFGGFGSSSSTSTSTAPLSFSFSSNNNNTTTTPSGFQFTNQPSNPSATTSFSSQPFTFSSSNSSVPVPSSNVFQFGNSSLPTPTINGSSFAFGNQQQQSRDSSSFPFTSNVTPPSSSSGIPPTTTNTTSSLFSIGVTPPSNTTTTTTTTNVTGPGGRQIKPLRQRRR